MLCSVFSHWFSGCGSVTDTLCVLFSVIGSVVVVGGYIQVSLWMMAAERQSHRIRNRFLYNVLRQDIGWFDTHETGELNTRLAE